MANRRTFGLDQSSMMQPSSMMSPRGNHPQTQDEYAMPYTEHPETMRRRITPMVGEPQDAPTMLQEMLAMMNGGQ